jgi:hypothetical protein
MAGATQTVFVAIRSAFVERILDGDCTARRASHFRGAGARRDSRGGWGRGAGNAFDGVAGHDAVKNEHGIRHNLGSYAGAFRSPIAGGMLVSSLELRNVLLAGLVFQLLPITSMYMLPETGLGRRPVANGSVQLSAVSLQPDRHIS